MGRVKLSELETDFEVDPDRVEKYAQMPDVLALPAEFIPAGGKKYLVDGAHRRAAHALIGDEDMEAVESSLPDDIKAKWLKKIHGI